MSKTKTIHLTHRLTDLFEKVKKEMEQEEMMSLSAPKVVERLLNMYIHLKRQKKNEKT